MADADGKYDQFLILHFVYHAIGTHANPAQPGELTL
jgi:hypothetical protein